MNPEFGGRVYWENTNKFLAGSDDTNKFYLRGTPSKDFSVDVHFCISMFPNDEEGENVRPVIFCDEQEGQNLCLRALFSQEFDMEKLHTSYPGSIDEMLGGLKEACKNNGPICAITFGVGRSTGEEVICIHAIPGMSPAFAVQMIQKCSEVELFGKSIDFGEF